MLLLLAIASAPLWAADVDSTALLRQVQSKALAGARTIPRYYCRQYLERQVFTPSGKPSSGCGRLPAAESYDPAGRGSPVQEKSGFSLVTSDRAHLDVMLAEAMEMFSWPGGGRFATNDPSDLLGGGFSGTGDFASYVLTVFSRENVTFQYLGACENAACVRYNFDVPVAVSGYMLKTPLTQATVGYHGTFDVDPQTADLLSMTVVPNDLSLNMPNACDLRTRMNYTRTTLSASEFVIPQSVLKEYLDSSGVYFTNWTQYTGCRQYSAESAVTFGDDALTSKTQGGPGPAVVHLPRPGTKLELRLTSKIDSNTSAAGDALEAALVRAIPDTAGGTIPKGTVVRGHLAQVEKVYYPKPGVSIAIRFDTMVLKGATLPVTLIPAGKQDLRGRAVFQFPQPKVTLNGAFTSEWRVQN